MAKKGATFTKASRFDIRSQLKETNLIIPPHLSKRSTTFGYGTKSDFTKSIENEGKPTPGSYTMTEFYARDRPSSPRYSFGKMDRDSGSRPSSPGPGTYCHLNHSSPRAKSPRYSMRPRTADPTRIGPPPTPGAGTYETRVTPLDSRNYSLSKYRSLKSTLIRPSKPVPPRLSPGPGEYTPQTDMTGDGRYFVSKISGSKCRKFGTSKRICFVD
jgi:hypothetical protein